MTDKIAPAFLIGLSEHKYKFWRVQKTISGIKLYLCDFSSWKLHFSDKTPLILVSKAFMKDLPTHKQLESLQQIAIDNCWNRRLCIVLLDGNGRKLKVGAKSFRSPSFVIIDGEDQRNILSSKSFTSALLDNICEQISPMIMAPYRVGGPVQGSHFFGRETVINKILSKSENNFAIFGVRRIGKTSLLKEILRLHNQENWQSNTVWLDCSTLPDSYCFKKEIVRQLNIRELPHLEDKKKFYFEMTDFLRRMHKLKGGTVTIFLDEADEFLKWARYEPDLLSSIRASLNAGYCRYVVAGFKELSADLFDLSGVFFGIFEPLRLGRFNINETRQMVLNPINSMRIRVENEDQFVRRIHLETSGHPLLIQYYCIELIDQLDTDTNPQLKLDLTNLDRIDTSSALRGPIIRVFMDNVDVEDKILIYALLCAFPQNKELFSQQEMYGALRRRSIYTSPEKVDQICDRLVMAGAFVREGREFAFAHKFLPRLLKTDYDLEWLLSEAKGRLADA